METKTFSEIRALVGGWSQRNFENNTSKSTGAVLQEVCSFLGLGEEGGELCDALLRRDSKMAEDSIADIGIYLSDAITRTNFFESEVAINGGIEDLINCCLNASSWMELEAMIKNACESPVIKDALGKSYWEYFPVESCLSPIELACYITCHLGHMQHAVLKRHQGIRGFLDDNKYYTKLSIHILGILVGCIKLNLRIAGGNYLETLNNVYFKVVEKRDWKKNAAEG